MSGDLLGKRIVWGGKRPFPTPHLHFVLLIIILLFTSACANSSTAPLPSNVLSSPDPNLLNESIQLNNPLALDNIRFEHISVEDGISQNDTIAILQDSDGFMWFGSEDGLKKIRWAELYDLYTSSG